jgi:gluconolactonase
MPVPKHVLAGTAALSILVVALYAALVGQSQAGPVVDLMTASGVGQFAAQWRYHDVSIVEVSSAATDKTIAGLSETMMKGGGGYRPDPPVPPRMTYDIRPKAGVANFDDSSWEMIPPETLPMYRGGGQLCFAWYRINLTMPEKVGDFATAGTAAFLNVNADDYGEVWVNGLLPRSLRAAALPNRHMIGGWNTMMHVPLTQAVKPGEKIQVAVFAMNGPISDTPTNRLFIRAAGVEFVR